MSQAKRKVLLVIMDGVGVREDNFGNAFNLAKHPNLDKLKQDAVYRTLFAHGTYVGMPANSDLGNSEVGHNAMGAGRIFDQGAKLVKGAVDNGSIYRSQTWRDIVARLKANKKTLHLIGLLSDGNVHSHEDHLYSIMREAKKSGLTRVRIHPLLDGRDVGETSAEMYVARLNAVINELASSDFDIAVASGGGRMNVTMDRYEADWSIVERGWRAHVLADAPHKFTSLDAAIATFRKDKLTDQYLPSFVIVDEKGVPRGPVLDGDAVIFFNFRGDRAVEISRAFDEEPFTAFDRVRFPDTYYAGMMEYDGDLKIPGHYLVNPPAIADTFGEYLVNQGLRQFACSETQKYGHVTFFWNGNRSGMFSETLENYVEVPSDRIEFDKKPAMKAKEITDVTIQCIEDANFDFGRINLANGDMVGHTGNLPAAISSVETVDDQIGRLRTACDKHGVVLVVTADHGNCEEMFDAKAKDFPHWSPSDKNQPKPKTSHTLNPVPFYIYVPKTVPAKFSLVDGLGEAGLANIANTVLVLLGMSERSNYLPSVVHESSR